MAYLTDWALVFIPGDGPCMTGKVHDHPKYNKMTGEMEDGHNIVTSTIKEWSWEHRWIQTRNTRYELMGPPKQEWVDWCRENGYTSVEQFVNLIVN